MDSISIKGSHDNPTIICDANKGLIELKGISIGEDPLMEIYRPILEWLKLYKENYQPETIVNIQLEYINTSSTRGLLTIFRILKSMQHENEDANLVINWYYQEIDLDMLETGEYFEEMIEFPFNFVKIKK